MRRIYDLLSPASRRRADAAAAAAEPRSPQASAAPDPAAHQRQRVNAILNAPEAKHRPKFANHLALKTDLTVEQAIGAMRCTPREVTSGGPGTVLGDREPSDIEAERLANGLLNAGRRAGLKLNAPDD